MWLFNSVSPFLPFLRHRREPVIPSGNHWGFSGMQESPAFWMKNLVSERQTLVVCGACQDTVLMAVGRPSPAYI